MPTFHYSVDDEPFETHLEVMTPREILDIAKFDPQKFYLIQIEGDHDVSYEGKLDERIHMHNDMKFITAKIGPTPVSSS